MSFLHIIKDKPLLQGTAYIELLPGKYRGKCWNWSSLFLDEDTFGFFEGIIQTHLPEYDHYAFTEVFISRWKPIVSRFKGLAAEVRAAREPADLPSDICYFMNDTEQRFIDGFKENARRLEKVADELLLGLKPRLRKMMQSLFLGCSAATPNPSFERTHSGKPALSFISFWAKAVLPPCAAQLKR